MVVSPFGPARERFHRPRKARPGAAPGDRVRKAALRVRGALAVLLVGAAPLVPGTGTDELVIFGLVVAVGWLPAAWLASRVSVRRPGTATDLVSLALDLALIGSVEGVLAPNPTVLLAGLLVFVAGATYLGGRWLGAFGGVAGVGVLAAVAAVSDRVDLDIDAFTLAVYPALLGVASWLVDAVATDRWQASVGLARLDERSDAILTGVGEAVVVTDRAGRVEQWNRAASTTFDCEAAVARGRSCHDAIGLLHGVRELDCSSGCALLGLGSEGSSVDVEVWRRAPNGFRQPLLASGSPVFDSSGALVEVVHSFRDITRLKQADEAKTLFLATASHELKTPLTVIRGFSQMLLLPDVILGDDERRAALRAIDARASQLSAIVDRLLMSSRIEAGRIDLEPVAVEVQPILRERVDAFERATAREMVLNIASDLPLVCCDAHAFATVVDHLLDNAVKYSPGGGPVTLRANPAPGGVEVSITDEGIGMTPEQAAHCFDRFWQAEASDVRRFGGTGIGLYIARSLVEGMNGSIVVGSVPGAGSTFWVLLRAAGPAVVPDQAPGDHSMIRDCMRHLGLGAGAREPVQG